MHRGYLALVAVSLVAVLFTGGLAVAQIAGEPTVRTQTFENVVTYTVPTETITTPGPTTTVTQTVTVTAPTTTAPTTTAPPPTTTEPPPPPPGGTTLNLLNQRFVCTGPLSAFGELPLTLEMNAANTSAAATNQQGLVDIRDGCTAAGHAGVDVILHIYGNGGSLGPGWDAVVTRKGSHDIDFSGFFDCGAIAPGSHQDGLDIRGGTDLTFVDVVSGNWAAQTHTCHGAGGLHYPGGFQASDTPDRRLDQVVNVLCIRCKMVGRNHGLRIENSTDTGAIDSCFAGDIPLSFGVNSPTDPNNQRLPLRPVNVGNVFVDRNDGQPDDPAECPL